MSLSRKIVLLALINLLLLAGALLVVARYEFRLGPEAVVLGPARGRVIAICNAFRLDLQSTPMEGRAGLLAAYRTRYAADIFVTDPRGAPLIGDRYRCRSKFFSRCGAGDAASGPHRPAGHERERKRKATAPRNTVRGRSRPWPTTSRRSLL